MEEKKTAAGRGRSGRKRAEGKQPRFRWDEPKELELLALLGRGYTLAEVARRLGCCKTSVKTKAKELGVVPGEVPVYPMNGLQTKFLRTANPYAVRGWVKRGWLGKPATSRATSGLRYHRFTRHQLEQFLEVEEAWVAWQPDDFVMDDLELERYVRELRAAAPWRWMPVDEVSRELGYSPSYVLDLIYKRFFADGTFQRYGGGWWVRSDEVARVKPSVARRKPGLSSLAEQRGEAVEIHSIRLTESQVQWLLGQARSVAAALRDLIDEAMAQERTGAGTQQDAA